MQLDAFTQQHLANWCHYQFPNDADDVRIRLTVFLAHADTGNAEWWVDQGWWRVYDAAQAAGYME